MNVTITLTDLELVELVDALRLPHDDYMKVVNNDPPLAGDNSRPYMEKIMRARNALGLSCDLSVDRSLPVVE